MGRSRELSPHPESGVEEMTAEYSREKLESCSHWIEQQVTYLNDMEELKQAYEAIKEQNPTCEIIDLETFSHFLEVQKEACSTGIQLGKILEIYYPEKEKPQPRNQVKHQPKKREMSLFDFPTGDEVQPDLFGETEIEEEPEEEPVEVDFGGCEDEDL